MLRLAHISDLHFGAIDSIAHAALKRSLDAADADAVIVTGDVTQAGRRREFKDAANFFGNFKQPLLVTPGNHDAPVYNLRLRMTDPWRRFQRFLGAETNAVLEIPNAVIVGLNSARRAGLSPDWSRGRLSLKQIDFAAAGMRAAPRAALKIIALHHPILPGPGRAGVNIVARARTALAAFAAAKTDLILTGHVHVAEAGVYSAEGASMIIARAGTATSTRLRGEAPSYNLICGDNTNITITISRFAGTGYTVAARRRFVKEHGCWRETPPALDEA